jgi:tetratricopeptide (TPR) repeat protein
MRPPPPHRALSAALPLALATVLASTTPSRAEPQPTVTPVAPASGLPPAAKAAAEAGISAMAKNKFDAAKTDFEKLLKLSPGNLSALINLGIVEFRLGHLDDSKTYLQRALAQKPDAGLAWMMVGVIDQDQQDPVAATAALAQAVYFEPKNPQAHNYFAVTLAARGWDSAAEDEFQRAIELAPDFGDAQFNLAVCYLSRVPPAIELARRHYQKALDLGQPPDPLIESKLNAPTPQPDAH